MAIKSLKHSSLTDNAFYRSVLAGNGAYFPVYESDDFLEQVVLSTTASSVTFSSLGTYATAGYKHLQIRTVAKGNANNFGNSSINLTFNGVTSGYSVHRIEANGSSVSAYGTGTRGRIDIWDATAESNASYAGVFGVSIIDVLDFSNSSKNTTVNCFTGSLMQNGTVNLGSGSYGATTAVTSLTLTASNGDFVSGSRFSLYGSKA